MTFPYSHRLPTLVVSAFLLFLFFVASTTASTQRPTPRIFRPPPARNTAVSGKRQPRPANLSQETKTMNKKQLIALLSAIVTATATASSEGVIDTTEDEARTLIGMKLRPLAIQLVVDAAGVDEEAAKTHLKAATDAQKATAQAKAAAKADAKEEAAATDDE